jgi:hypothetical protein
LLYAQRYTHVIDWSSFTDAQQMLQQSNAFGEGDDAKLKVDWGLGQDLRQEQVAGSDGRCLGN